MAEDTLLFLTSLIKRQARARGPLDSRIVNDSFDEIHADLVQLGDILNRLFLGIDRGGRITTREDLTAHLRLKELEKYHELVNRFLADRGERLTYSTTFRNTQDIDLSRFAEARRLRVDSVYGQVTVPYNGYRSRFHIVRPADQKLFVPGTLVTDVVPVSEGAGTVTAGTPVNAFNGQNESFWMRSVSFPLGSDASEVSAYIDIDVPLDFAQDANVFTINPYPQGQVDVTKVEYSVDATPPSLPLPGFPGSGINNALPTRLLFAAIGITKLRVWLRQREWIEREGLKVFEYGAQEIDLALVDFDKTDQPSLQNNNAMVLAVDTPDGFNFNKITNFFTAPNWEVGGLPTGLFVQLYADINLTTQIWNSLTDPDPQATNIDVSPHGISRLYMLVVLKYQITDQITPVLEQLGFEYTVTT